jgi:hypothetical protein
MVSQLGCKLHSLRRSADSCQCIRFRKVRRGELATSLLVLIFNEISRDVERETSILLVPRQSLAKLGCRTRGKSLP